ncbi:hypothetical protein BST27_25035 [Mycobacterium intermedium]|uniref:Uncharacterized protein n=1 Tax=Mycobacterium intermedium TaxID=28445 RepID=A0A1E3S6G2_MYCIE|nr:hypothetical protein [Mycobacterium intermedium]MCV6966403.1 hypothetical protein [Mycobacterium intermedium]ODQ97232.1 hypothetical protein BHQ20_27265 [Mycobacterium intermedium]OPE46253.1 hypothetical protein BV508_26625 [Mycobacterium intermedium]ORA96570.1 hypothetical protein BST27_25035 [Mycobacterium intermedium]
MDLKWWPVVAVACACFAATVLLAALLPMTRLRKRLRPLANVARLTRLPEYAKVARLRTWSTIATLILLTVTFGAAAWAGARPAGASKGLDATHPEDIMICVGQPVTDAATAELLDYFARQAGDSYQTQRIGLTSVNRRVVPLTRDYQYAAAQFADYARAGAAESAAFAPRVPYLDYAASVNDSLALCISGFPSFEKRSTHRRSVIYLGPSDLRVAGDRRATLFAGGSVRDLADRAGVQLNVIDTAPSPASGSLLALTEQTGGRYLAPDLESGAGAVTKAVNEIRANTPPARLADGAVVEAEFFDAPVLPLAIGMVSAAVLSVTLLMLRR